MLDQPAKSYLLKKTTFEQILDIILDSTSYEMKEDHVEVRVTNDPDGHIASLLETFCKRDAQGAFTPRTRPSNPGKAFFNE